MFDNEAKERGSSLRRQESDLDYLKFKLSRSMGTKSLVNSQASYSSNKYKKLVADRIQKI